MTGDPWDIPTIPWRGDLLPEKTHAARSRALDAWELTEVSLCLLDHFLAQSLGISGRYGSGLIFTKRLELLEVTENAFAIKHPDQEGEGVFKKLVCHLRKFALRRHDIAHGMVQPLITIRNKDAGHVEFALLPPLYTIQRRTNEKYFPNFAYTESMLLEFAAKFDALQKRVQEFTEATFPQLLP